MSSGDSFSGGSLTGFIQNHAGMIRRVQRNRYGTLVSRRHDIMRPHHVDFKLDLGEATCCPEGQEIALRC